MIDVNSTSLSAKHHCPHRVHYAANNSEEHCQKRCELRATTWKMLRASLLSPCVTYTRRPGNPAVSDKQQLTTRAHGAVPQCFSSQAAIRKAAIRKTVLANGVFLVWLASPFFHGGGAGKPD